MKYRWELLLWLWLAFFFNQADRQVFNVVLPLLRHDLGLTDVQLGLVGSVFVAANGLMVPVAGFLGDIFSRKRIVVLSLFAWSLATLCTGFGTSLLYFLVVRSVATAVGEAFFFPSAIAMLAFEHEKTRARDVHISDIGLFGADRERMARWCIGRTIWLAVCVLDFRKHRDGAFDGSGRASARGAAGTVVDGCRDRRRDRRECEGDSVAAGGSIHRTGERGHYFCEYRISRLDAAVSL
jgi:hypothetical protein